MKLGYTFQKYLRGSDLTAAVTVEIMGLLPVQVIPHPSAAPRMKLCLLVKGLPEHLPGAILIGPTAETTLSLIFGKGIEFDALKGKKVEIYPYQIKVSGIEKMAIGFRKPKPAPAA